MDKKQGWIPGQYKFVTETLPKRIYVRLRSLAEHHKITQGDIVILGVMAICAMGKDSPESVASLVSRIKNKEYDLI